MPGNRLSLGEVLAGGVSVDNNGGLKIAGTAVNATAAELNAVADLSAAGAVRKTISIPLTAATHGTNAEVDTGVDLPTKAVVTNVMLLVTTAEVTGGTKTMDIGLLSSETGGDADGFLDNISVVATGVKIGSLVSGAVTLGALMKETVTDGGTNTHSSPRPHNAQAVTARSISVTSNSAFTEFAGTLLIEYIKVN